MHLFFYAFTNYLEQRIKNVLIEVIYILNWGKLLIQRRHKKKYDGTHPDKEYREKVRKWDTIYGLKHNQNERLF